MSSPGAVLGPSHPSFKRKCPYKAKLDTCMVRLDQARAQLQATLEERRLIQERTNVLCDMISTQACVVEQLGKHWSWLHTMQPEQHLEAPADSPVAAESAAAAPAAAAADQASTQHQGQYQQHTCVRLVEAASPQLLQQALSMTTLDWVKLGRSHFRELAVLLELVNRPPHVYRDDPSAFAAAAAVAASLSAETDAAAGQPALEVALPAQAAAAAAMAGTDQQHVLQSEPSGQQTPSTSGSAAFSSGTEAAAAAALSSDDCSLPWEQDPMRLLVEALCRQGPRMHAALLHRSLALMEAGSINMETMQPELPSPSFWRCAVDRLHLSPSQVLHFKVAAQEYRRLMRAAAAAGLDLIQVTKEFSLSDVAAKYAQDSEQTADTAATSADGCDSQPSDQTAAAAAAGCSSANLQTAGTRTAAANGRAPFNNAAGSGSSGPELSSSGTTLGGVLTTSSTTAAAAAGGAAAAEDEQLTNVSAMQHLDAKLQRHLNSFFSNLYLVNTFCTNVLTPYQHAVMWCASYPYFPILGAMAEALEKLPATEVMPLPAHVQARIHANIQQHTARREVVIEQQRKNLCWWEQ